MSTQLTGNPLARKIVMAVSGMAMVVFVGVHLLGNTSFFRGASSLNAYAATLQGLGPFLWIVRTALCAAAALHIFYGVELTLENRAAKPQSYAVRKRLRSTVSSRTMIWSGSVIGLFISYHLLHFTFHVFAPAISAGSLQDSSGRPDVFRMVYLNFQNNGIVALYLVGISALLLHLTHGIESMMQTLGLSTEKTQPWIIRAGRILAVVIGLGLISIPIAVLSGAIR
ncbi:MAG: succinate dehydrogenase cytochrome b subunit [Thermodesulfovibrionales bacterium]